MKLEVGKTYLDRKGQEVLIKEITNKRFKLNVIGEVKGKGIDIFTSEGKHNKNGNVSMFDLIQEKELKNEPIFNI